MSFYWDILSFLAIQIAASERLSEADVLLGVWQVTACNILRFHVTVEYSYFGHRVQVFLLTVIACCFV